MHKKLSNAGEEAYRQAARQAPREERRSWAEFHSSKLEILLQSSEITVPCFLSPDPASEEKPDTK